ncbi:MAG TPA: EAL domain-containing protein [Gammaproteobacteria bacterium]|nr:EAL domain-containing protein [Gammaproteobacteria bacterium]
MNAALLFAGLHVLQAVLATLLALILFEFYRLHRRSYLLRWAASFAALLVASAAMAASVWLRGVAGWLPPLLNGVTLVAVYAQMSWLLLGTLEVTAGRPLSGTQPARLPSAAVTVAALAVLSFAMLPRQSGFETGLWLVMRYGLPGVALLAMAVLVVKRGVLSKGLGARLLTGVYVLYGAGLLHVPLLHLMGGVSGIAPLEYGAWLVLFELVLTLLVAIGMVGWLLEEERVRAAHASEEAMQLAFHDALTGLPNRRLLLDRLSQAIAQAERSGEKVLVAFMDLDRFKVINDSLGHKVGDELLCAAATRLKHKVRAGDTVARIGGDEFTLVFGRLTRRGDIISIADSLLRTIRAPFFVEGHELYATTSIGLSVYPDDGRDAETLLKNADLAMYRAKESGRNNYQLYTPAMNAHSVAQLALENDFRRALASGDLLIYFQPILDAATREIVAVEALVRWRHIERGVLVPDDFLAVAESLGLMDALDAWVLPAACRQVRLWQRRYAPNLRLAVNLSVRPFQQSDMVAKLERVLAETDFHPRYLEIEITETTAMRNVEVGLDTLRQLKNLGVHVSIDDFGTGYSSLSYLRQFPVDKVKIDKTFVRDLLLDEADTAIVRAVVPLAHSLGMKVIAEGVETDAQLVWLRELGCDLVQGYLFHPPLPPERLEELLARGYP